MSQRGTLTLDPFFKYAISNKAILKNRDSRVKDCSFFTVYANEAHKSEYDAIMVYEGATIQ